jgi:hypothetical protein
VVSRIIPGQQDAYRHFMGRVAPLLADSGLKQTVGLTFGLIRVRSSVLMEAPGQKSRTTYKYFPRGWTVRSSVEFLSHSDTQGEE